MISCIHILILAVSVAVGFCGRFCENGRKIKLQCPEDSLVTGIQSTGELFSAVATPVCSKLADEVLLDYRAFAFFYKYGDNLPGDDFHYFSVPKFACKDRHYAVKDISLCFEYGDITETGVECRRLKSFSPSSVYTVRGDPHSPVLKCGEGSVLRSFMYERDDEGNLIAVASCAQQKPPSALLSCSVGQKTKNSLRVSCNKDQDGGLEPSFLMEVHIPDSSLLYSLPSQSPDFTLRGLRPGKEYLLIAYAVNSVGRGPPLTVKASTLPKPKKRSGRDGCEDGQLVEVVCPDGYLVTGVETQSRIFSPDVSPVCSKIADKINPAISSSKSRLYHTSNPLLQAHCSGTDPILLNFSMCFVDDVIRRITTHCSRLQDNVTVTAYYNIEGLTSSSVLKCPEGSFSHGFKMQRTDAHVKVRGKCTVIEE